MMQHISDVASLKYSVVGEREMWTFLWLSHNSEKVTLLLSHFVITATHLVLSTYYDMTVAATVTTINGKGNIFIGLTP